MHQLLPLSAFTKKQCTNGGKTTCLGVLSLLLALESIYGEDVFIFDTVRGLKSFQVHVHIEAPDEITVSTKLNSSSDLETAGNDIDEFSYSFEVKYLPPIVLTYRRAVSGSVSPHIDVPSIRSYNDERLHENFQQNNHECCICFSEYAGTEFISLPCQHFFCQICMKTYSSIHVHEGTVNMLQCPDAKCRGIVPPGVLKRLLSDEEYESFCTLCGGPRHVGDNCLDPELKLKILQERQNSSLLKGKKKHRERDRINELLSIKEILRVAKLCPSCKMAVSRIGGCNKMFCTNCGQYFCYQCNQAINEPTAHESLSTTAACCSEASSTLW
ncbi:E3 ubiquitin ligase RBR family [Trema orientale]|uniref:E3 ubiquitin ligase RBR family n=1 Tax=Trema orientale TaxID=63057 RepID=A0A2P5AT07_TREOI|nr:E3 ubiquitin ligase RBR family [Trema orientale]